MDSEIKKYINLIKDYIFNNYKNNFRKPVEGVLPYPFIVPGAFYTNQLWDWDSWLTGYALMSIDDPDIKEYQIGCILDFLNEQDELGRIPLLIQDTPCFFLPNLKDTKEVNIHKPCLAQHALEIIEKYNDYHWIEDKFDNLVKFVRYFETSQYHEESGLFYWFSDLCIGFDNDPTVFYRPDKSTAPIYLNALMYSEQVALAKIAEILNRNDIKDEFIAKSNKLKTAINNECFDNKDGFYYSCDISLRPVDPNVWLHSGYPRFWHTLPIKITTWAGMLPLWNKIASKEQADRVVKNYLDKEGLFSDFGIRSVAKYEKMYRNVPSGNPSCWLGPIWINANYMTYIGLKNYGYDELANAIAIKTIKLLGKDIEECGQFHEYYDADSGLGINGLGFQSWNFLVLKLIEELENNGN